MGHYHFSPFDRDLVLSVEWMEECQATLMDFVGDQGTEKQGPLAQSLRCENTVANPLWPPVSELRQHK